MRLALGILLLISLDGVAAQAPLRGILSPPGADEDARVDR
ncbi:hypothetical protein OKW11_004795 [Pseudomonas baetica]|nr:hypothetical protein [Pseudomonas baetica]